MQSFLQYKRFGAQVKAQYERDRKRAEALERGNAENDTSSNPRPRVGEIGHRRSSIDTSPDSRDPEKAEQPPTTQTAPPRRRRSPQKLNSKHPPKHPQFRDQNGTHPNRHRSPSTLHLPNTNTDISLRQPLIKRKRRKRNRLRNQLRVSRRPPESPSLEPVDAHTRHGANHLDRIRSWLRELD